MNAEQLRLPLRFLRLIECASPEEAPDHHLERRPSGLYRMRVCLISNPKMIGKHRKISLRTKDLELARIRRDRLLESFERHGLIPKVRIQKVRGHSPMHEKMKEVAS